jgi:hypothetical protein
MSYTCEKCGKVTEKKFGSGRFCSRACANTRVHSAETREKIKQSVNKQTVCQCQFCGKKLNTLSAKASHERLCKYNPNQLPNPAAMKKGKQNRPVILYKADNLALDITYGDLERYRESHPVCEICGKAVSEVTKWNSKFAAKNLCIDHDHTTGKFRGLLCQICNRQLGWYENNKENIQKYLDK